MLPPDLLAALGPTWPAVLDALRPAAVRPLWATVDFDRSDSPSSPLPDSHLLGARIRAAHPGSDSGVLLGEPSTEGPLAAFLARHGEGWAAAYALVDRVSTTSLKAAGLRLSTPAEGPLGPERRVLGGSRFGPFILVASRPR